MKFLKFTLYSLVFTAALSSGVNAQNRGEGGGRSEHQSRDNHNRPNTNNTMHRGQAPRIQQGNRNVGNMGQVHSNRDIAKQQTQIRTQQPVRHQPQSTRDIARKDRNIQNRSQSVMHTTPKPHVNNRPETIHNRGAIRIQRNDNFNTYSYGKPVHQIDHNRYARFHYNNVSFYGYNGMYYKPYNNSYVRFMPPFGFRLNILPIGSISINIGTRPYYFYEGVYYENYRNEYRVVEPPMGAIVYALPSGYEKVEYNGEIYYEFAGALYEKIYYRGERAYELVGYLS